MLAAALARYQPVWLEQMRLGAPFWVGPTGQTGLFFDGRWNSESVFVQLIAKLDEAGTHKDADYMTMGGYVGRLGQWNRFDHKWGKALRKAKPPYFHVVEHGDDPFALKAVRIADENLMAGFVTRLDKADYQKYYRDGDWGGKAQPDSMYGLCFRYCLSFVLEIALAEVSRENLVINFITESGHENEGAPAEIVSQLKRKHISGASEFFGNAATDEKEKSPGLQAADGLASGAWHIEKVGMSLSAPMHPAKALANWDPVQTGWKIPISRCHIDENHLREFKDGQFAHLEYRKKWGQQRTAEILAAKRSSELSEGRPS